MAATKQSSGTGRSGSGEGSVNARENEPDRVIARELVARFASDGGRLGLLNPAEVTRAVDSVFNVLAERGWRIHKDYPVCGECREKVKVRAAAAKEWGETTGAAVAATMLFDAREIAQKGEGE